MTHWRNSYYFYRFTVRILTSIQLRKLLPYFCWNVAFISFKSISQRVTSNRINCLSFVPNPTILLCKSSAKYSDLFIEYFRIASKPFSMSPLNSFLIAFSKLCPAIDIVEQPVKEFHKRN